MAHHDHSHGKDHQHHDHRPQKGGIHRSPIFWVAVLLMLAGMFAYVATMDEAIGPGGQVNQEVPADAE
jgi:hypothetical protein